MSKHIYHFEDAAQTRGERYPLCGQANAAGGTVISAGDPIPDDVTCKRCIKRQEATA
jgi:hypothetical protein